MSKLLIIRCKPLLQYVAKKYSTACIYSKEFTVSPFCNLFITCPFNVKIRPLDVHAYPNCDRVIIKLYSKSPAIKYNINFDENRDNFRVFGESFQENIDCLIETPIKSDISASISKAGNLNVKKFNGDSIILQTDLGSIVSESCQTSRINFGTNGGNITTLGTLHAAEINLATKKLGYISANHLQALKAKIDTENGDVTVKSSYCDETVFRANGGKLVLDNIHKNCSVSLTENGVLQMTGFDGTLTADIKEAEIDIQASKLYDTSTIKIKNKSSLTFRISDWIQENTEIKTACQQLKVADNVNLAVKNEGSCAVLLMKNTEVTSKLIINADLSNVCIEGASWSDMLKLKGIHFSD